MSPRERVKVAEDVSAAFTAVSKKTTDVTKRNVSIAMLELKDVLKRVSAQIKIDLQAAILRILVELVHDDNEALQNVPTCRDVLHNRVAGAI